MRTLVQWKRVCAAGATITTIQVWTSPSEGLELPADVFTLPECDNAPRERNLNRCQFGQSTTHGEWKCSRIGLTNPRPPFTSNTYSQMCVDSIRYIPRSWRQIDVTVSCNSAGGGPDC